MTTARIVVVATTTHHGAAFGRVNAATMDAPSERLTSHKAEIGRDQRREGKRACIRFR